ncbi:hypothetical protein GCM10027072_46750 [Streptomyces bullii]
MWTLVERVGLGSTGWARGPVCTSRHSGSVADLVMLPCLQDPLTCTTSWGNTVFTSLLGPDDADFLGNRSEQPALAVCGPDGAPVPAAWAIAQ